MCSNIQASPAYGQMDKTWSTKYTYKTKDRVTRIPLKTGVELRCSGRVNSSCSTSGTRRVIIFVIDQLDFERRWCVLSESDFLGHFFFQFTNISCCYLKAHIIYFCIFQFNGQKKKVQMDKTWSTKYTYKTKDRVTRIPLKTGVELRCSGRVNS
jgi:hypothetical protein